MSTFWLVLIGFNPLYYLQPPSMKSREFGGTAVRSKFYHVVDLQVIKIGRFAVAVAETNGNTTVGCGKPRRDAIDQRQSQTRFTPPLVARVNLGKRN